MWSNFLIFYAASLICPLLSTAQFTLDAASCIPGSGVTAFSACQNLYSTISQCTGPSVISEAETFDACFCNQGLFNLYYSYGPSTT